MRFRTRIFLALVALLVAASAIVSAQNNARLFQAGKLRALILSGRNNHEWRVTTPYLKKLLVDSGRFDVRVTEEPTGMTAATLAAYDVVVSDYCGPRWGETAEKALVDFVKSGKGLVIVHAADYSFGTMPVLGDHMTSAGFNEPAWTEYGDMVGAVWTAGPPRTGHGKRHIFQVKFTVPDHPVASGMSESFIADDELYFNFEMRPGAKVIATAFNAKEMNGSGKDEPILWTVDYGKGRVFHTALGHDLMALMEPGFKVSFARGSEWAATRAVTLPATWPKEEPNPDAVRVLVVTGGHSHDTTFYSLFEGYPDMAVNVDNHPFAYARKDWAKKYDVLVLYDLIQEIPEEQKQALRAFVESGKGLVVLHHAIADFNNWEWWWKEVVGVHYLVAPLGDAPRSTYKHGQEVMVQQVAAHPILYAVGPLHMIEETYKQVWVSPKNTILMKTDHPLAEGPMAWVSAYDKSRVFATMMGHDHQVHTNPGYRRLVRNAILWTAGRPTK
jgi:type 1 glutamine amidotransferase